MKIFGIGILTLEIAFFVFCAIALVYLINKRIKDKKQEDFEERDN